MDLFQLYFKMIGIKIRSQMEYKLSFLLMVSSHFLITFIEFIGMYALFMRFNQIKGWTFAEVAVFYGFINTAYAVAETIGRGYDLFHQHVQKGTFDRFILRPRSLHFQIISSEFPLLRFGRMAQGIIVLVWGFTKLQLSMNMFDWLILMFSLICAVLFFIGLMIFQATLSFWSVESLEIMNAFTYGGVQTAQYPIDIYKDWFKKIFIYILPIGSVSYFPLVSILRGTDYALGLFMPSLGIVFYFIGKQSFKIGIRYYCSTGS